MSCGSPRLDLVQLRMRSGARDRLCLARLGLREQATIAVCTVDRDWGYPVVPADPGCDSIDELRSVEGDLATSVTCHWENAIAGDAVCSGTGGGRGGDRRILAVPVP